MNNLFYIYLSLYPDKADIIFDAIRRGIEEADSLYITGKKRNAVISSFILESLDWSQSPEKYIVMLYIIVQITI